MHCNLFKQYEFNRLVNICFTNEISKCMNAWENKSHAMTLLLIQLEKYLNLFTILC